MAREYSKHPRVIGYDLLVEPHDLSRDAGNDTEKELFRDLWKDLAHASSMRSGTTQWIPKLRFLYSRPSR